MLIVLLCYTANSASANSTLVASDFFTRPYAHHRLDVDGLFTTSGGWRLKLLLRSLRGELLGRVGREGWAASRHELGCEGWVALGLLDRVACLGSWAVAKILKVGKWWLMELVATGG